MKNTTGKTLNRNKKTLNRSWKYMCGCVYIRVISAIKKSFQNLKIKRSFSKMPFFKMPIHNDIIYT